MDFKRNIKKFLFMWVEFTVRWVGFEMCGPLNTEKL